MVTSFELITLFIILYFALLYCILNVKFGQNCDPSKVNVCCTVTQSQGFVGVLTTVTQLTLNVYRTLLRITRDKHYFNVYER